MLAQQLTTSQIGTGSLALLATVVLIPALGALVKWWMGGTERSIQAIAESVRQITAAVSDQSKAIAVLDVHRTQHAEEIRVLRERQHEIGGALQRIEGKVDLHAKATR